MFLLRLTQIVLWSTAGVLAAGLAITSFGSIVLYWTGSGRVGESTIPDVLTLMFLAVCSTTGLMAAIQLLHGVNDSVKRKSERT